MIVKKVPKVFFELARKDPFTRRPIERIKQAFNDELEEYVKAKHKNLIARTEELSDVSIMKFYAWFKDRSLILNPKKELGLEFYYSHFYDTKEKEVQAFLSLLKQITRRWGTRSETEYYEKKRLQNLFGYYHPLTLEAVKYFYSYDVLELMQELTEVKKKDLKEVYRRALLHAV